MIHLLAAAAVPPFLVSDCVRLLASLQNSSLKLLLVKWAVRHYRINGRKSI